MLRLRALCGTVAGFPAVKAKLFFAWAISCEVSLLPALETLRPRALLSFFASLKPGFELLIWYLIKGHECIANIEALSALSAKWPSAFPTETPELPVSLLLSPGGKHSCSGPVPTNALAHCPLHCSDLIRTTSLQLLHLLWGDRIMPVLVIPLFTVCAAARFGRGVLI